MKFFPFTNKIQILPIKEETFIPSDNNFPEKGKVIAVGKDVKFVKVNDILHFVAWGLQKTPLEDGKQYFVVEEDSRFIIGKESDEKEKSKRV